MEKEGGQGPTGSGDLPTTLSQIVRPGGNSVTQHANRNQTEGLERADGMRERSMKT